jgi:hypothetical protein
VQFVKLSVIIAFAYSCVGSAMNGARTPNPMLPEKEGFKSLELKHAWLAFAKCSAQWTILNADLCVFRDDSHLQNVPPYGPERHQIFGLTNAVMLTNVTGISNRHSTSQFP